MVGGNRTIPRPARAALRSDWGGIGAETAADLHFLLDTGRVAQAPGGEAAGGVAR